MTVVLQLFDFYVIGGRAGFYVGQALRKESGGWERRIIEHLRGKGSPAAQLLLLNEKMARCLGSVCAGKGYANGVEARAWDLYASRGWHPVHRRPGDGTQWGRSGIRHTLKARQKMRRVFSAEHCAKISAALRGRIISVEQRKRIAATLRGRQFSLEWRAKLSATSKGRKHSAATRQKISLGRRGKGGGLPRTEEVRAKISRKLQGHPTTAKTRAAVSASNRRRVYTPEMLVRRSRASQAAWAKRRTVS